MFLNYKFSRRESYTYTSAWKTGILLTELSSETKINAPLLQIHHVCCCRMSRMHREARKIWDYYASCQVRAFIPSKSHTWNYANIIIYHLIMQYIFDERRYFIHRHQYFESRITDAIMWFSSESKKSDISKYIFTLYRIDRWLIIFLNFKLFFLDIRIWYRFLFKRTPQLYMHLLLDA